MFFSLGVFAILDTTANNLQASYNSLVKKGNLNDLIVNEKYDYGPLTFKPYDDSGREITNETTPFPKPNDKVWIKLTEESKNVSIIQVAFEKDPNRYKGYKDKEGILMSWTGYIPNTPTPDEPIPGEPTPSEPDDSALDWIANQVKLIRNNFIDLLENDPNLSVKNELIKLGVSYRDYQSLEFSDGVNLTKIVDSNPEDQINKLVIYQGNPLTRSISDRFKIYEDIYKKIVNSSLGVDVLKNPVETLKINQKDLIDFYSNLSKNATTYPNIKSVLDKAISNNGKLDDTTNESGVTNSLASDRDTLYKIFSDQSESIDENFRFSIKWSSLNSTITIQDLSMFEVVISPGNWDYLKQTKSVYTDLKTLNEKQQASGDEFHTWLSQLDSKYKIKIGNTEYLIKGVGLTPDFMYPIFNINSLVPNPKVEFLYFLNSSGYNAIHNSNLTSPIEKYIVGIFNTKKMSEKINLLNEINVWCGKNMSWPDNMNAAYFADDTSNYLNLNAARTTFITTLIQTISTVSAMLIGVILGLALFVSVLVIKNYISKNKFSLAVLQSNGYPKWKICLSLLPFSIIPCFIGATCGYTLGISLQDVAMNIFSYYWFIPTDLSPFNILAYMICIIFPIIFFIFVTLIVGWFVLRKNVVESLKNDSDYKISKFSLLMKKPFNSFSVVSRFKVALAFNAFWKLIILSFLSASIMVVFNFSWSSNGLFEKNRINTLNTHHYKYSVDLETPTEQSGVIKYQPLESLGATDNIPVGDDPSFYLLNSSKSAFFWGSQNTKAQKYQWDNIHLIQMKDLTEQQSNITYLENLVQSKLMLDYDIAGLVNPWSTSASLMPINQLSSSNDYFQKLLRAVWYDDGLHADAEKYIEVTKNPETDVETFQINQKNVKNNLISMVINGVFKKEYLAFIDKVFNEIKNGTLLDEYGERIYNYSLSYNLIGLDQTTIGNDENSIDPNTIEYANGKSSPKYSYTRLNAVDKASNKLSIYGIKNWIPNDGTVPDNYLGPVLTNKNGEIVNYKLFNTNLSSSEYPLIVNLYTAEKYNLSVGSKFKLNVDNLYDRYTRKIKGEPLTKEVHFKVVDINNSAKDNELYTSYKFANEILGFTQEEINRNLPFNGYYANNVANFNASMPLFSPSGLYPGTNSFSENNPIIVSLVSKTIEKGESDRNYSVLKKALNLNTLIPGKENEYIKELNTIYSNLPYNSMISYISNVSSNNELFQTIAGTTIVIQNIILGITIPIVLLVVVLISNMLIEELRKIGIKLKALGFSNWEILSSFLSIYVPVFVVGLIVSIPTTIGLIAKYNSLIATSSNIILSASLTPGMVIVSFLLLTLFFIFSFVVNWIILRKLKISKEIKSF
ncbi:ABC transporter permease [Mycoplasmoides pirum]|uniref:ABC transporter permease n=1 Tax=Mycoplasmoides pirum TaxID=2122 RepID=UPI0004846932|nr:ABC transporter permease [Mycoplasmoides pirum]